jgi:hypothetical protein
MHELGFKSGEGEAKKGLSFGRLKKGWEEKREDKRVEKGSHWGADAGRAEEQRVLEMLEKKWVKMNDTVSHSRLEPESCINFAADQHAGYPSHWTFGGNHAFWTRNSRFETTHSTSSRCLDLGEYASTPGSVR